MNENINLLIDEFYKTFYRIEELELKKNIRCLTINEFHIIDTINEDTLNMNELSDKLNVTMGTATTTIDNLVKKKFVKREREDEDRRRVNISLTNKGLLALTSHKTFHNQMIKLITKNLSEKELQSFSKIFGKLHSNLYDTFNASKPKRIYEFTDNQTLKVVDVLGSRGIRDFLFKEDIKIGSILKIIDRNNETLFLINESKNIEIDRKDGYNILAVPYL